MKLSDARVLFVDDEPQLLQIFSYWFSGADQPRSISTAPDGQEALEMMQADSYDLLITDVNMPRRNGTSLIRGLSEAGITIPAIIFVSGFGDVDEREMYGLGVDAFFPKPVVRDQLTRAARNALAERSSLWRERLETLPRQSISIDANECCENPHPGGIVLGRGGFTAPYTAPIAPGKVSFDCVSVPRRSTDDRRRFRSMEIEGRRDRRRRVCLP